MSVTETTNDPLTYEKILAIFQETDKRLDRRFAESDERFARRIAETERLMKESSAKVDKQIEANNQQYGEMANRYGEMVEHMVVPNIVDKFNSQGFDFISHYENRKSKNAEKQVIAQIDLVLESKDILMVVEIKAKPTKQHVDEHINRILRFGEQLREIGEKRIFMGALAGAIMSDTVRDYAHENGLYVLEQSGDTMHIVTPKDFKPQQWYYSLRG